jgi:hypothetical protein
MRHFQRWLASALVAVCILVGLGTTDAGAATPAIAVTPNPIVIALNGAPVANPAALVPVTFTATGFMPHGRVAIYMSGSLRTKQTLCTVTTSPAACVVSPAPVGPGTYSVRVRYFPNLGGAGPSLAIDVPVVVTP